MNRAWGWLAVVVGIASCGGKAKVSGTPEGVCSASGNLWSCVSSDAGDPGDAGTPTLLAGCPSNVASGVSCGGDDQTVDTTNPQLPAHLDGDCFQCTDDGLGVHWSCGSQGYQWDGVYSCQ